MILYDYFRSSASYRVRIALNLKEVEYKKTSINLIDGDQITDDYKNKNPQGLVPTLEDDGIFISQSLAICEYLDEKFSVNPLMPKDDINGRAYVRTLADIIACDTHPLNNLRVLNYLQSQFGIDDSEKMKWYKHWLLIGLESVEETINRHSLSGKYCFGDTQTLADIYLIPQLYNADRFEINYSHLNKVSEIKENCLSLEAFIKAHPDNR